MTYTSNGDKFTITDLPLGDGKAVPTSHRIKSGDRHYLYANGDNKSVVFKYSSYLNTNTYDTNDQSSWLFISEKQYEYRPKLDALVSFLDKMSTKSAELEAAISAAKAVQSAATLPNPDVMIERCTQMIAAAYDAENPRRQIYVKIVEATNIAIRLKQIFGQTPTDIKQAIGSAFAALVGSDEDAVSTQKTNLNAIVQNYINTSLTAYKEIMAQASEMGFSTPESLLAAINNATTSEQYEAVATNIRTEFKSWLNKRIEANKGFAKGAKFSMLVVNNSTTVLKV